MPLEVPPRPGSSEVSVALCLELNDLVLSKCAAGRQRDWDFALDALRAGLVDGSDLLGRIDGLPLDRRRRDEVRSMVEGLVRRARA